MSKQPSQESEALNLAVLVLAAGRGERAGGPKALQQMRGGPALLTLISAYAPHVVGPLGAVVSPRVAGALDPVVPPGLELILNDAPDRAGAVDSLELGLRSLGAGRPVLITPVDCPAPSRHTLALLWRALDGRTAIAAQPTYDGRPGHPVLLSKVGQQEFLENPERLDHFLAGQPTLVQVPIDDESILANWNDETQW